MHLVTERMQSVIDRGCRPLRFSCHRFPLGLVINLSNSLGAMAARNSRSTAEALSKANAIRDDRTELTRLQKALEKLGSCVAIDQTAVDAAQRAADAGTTAKERECGNGDPKQRGPFCREKEGAERMAAEALTKTTAAKAIYV